VEKRILVVDDEPASARFMSLALEEASFRTQTAFGSVEALLAMEDNFLQIGVRDNGPGLSPAVRANLFRLGSTTKPSGAGFGLYLARRLVESRGGSLVAEAESAGGATFTVRFPISKG